MERSAVQLRLHLRRSTRIPLRGPWSWGGGMQTMQTLYFANISGKKKQYNLIRETRSAKSWPNFNFFWGGGRLFWGSQNSKCQVLAKFQFSEGMGVFWAHTRRVNWDFWSQIYPIGDSLSITDSPSHITYVETNEYVGFIKSEISIYNWSRYSLWHRLVCLKTVV